MTEVIEGVVHKINNWKDGKGADVELHNEEGKYFYYGSMDIPIGVSCRFEVQDGEGEQKGKWEILNVTPLKTNPVIPNNIKQNMQPPSLPVGPQMVKMPFDKFQEMYDKGTKATLRRTSLEIAAGIYDSMNKVEKDPKAAAETVILIARILEGYLE